MKDPDQRLPATLAFGGTWTVSAIFYNALWFYAARERRLLYPWVTDRRIRERSRRYLGGPIMYGATIPLAFISPWISIAIFAGLALLYLLPQAE